jgi:F420H(2)-dependent quinone reductase
MTDMTDVCQPNVSEQVALYEATDGREGGALGGRTVVVLTTNGAKSGNNSKNPVMRIKSGATHVAVASNGGGPATLRSTTTVAHPKYRCATARRCIDFAPEKCTVRKSRTGGWPPNASGRISRSSASTPATARFR